MHPIFQKLNYKGQPAIHIINAPASFTSVLEAMQAITTVHQDLAAKDVPFALAFAVTQQEVDRFADQVAQATSGEAIVWIAYPKSSSKNYKCEFNRDTGWARLGAHGFEPVRQVAIDEDWSALRFRRGEHIKKMTRGFAISEGGRKRTGAPAAGEMR